MSDLMLGNDQHNLPRAHSSRDDYGVHGQTAQDHHGDDN